MKNNGKPSSNLTFSGAFFLTLLVLKLTHVINWSWWWVTAPIWGGVAIVLIGFIMYTIWYLIYSKNDDVTDFDIKESKFMKKLKERMEESDEKRNLN